MVIAHCVGLANEIFRDHVLYTTSAMLHQLDIDLGEEAERLLREPPAGCPRSTGVWLVLRTSGSQ